MNFKEVRLSGFKSFADKTTIKFEDGVTCIVGPNGCGKSNVADAVRWVLGEQSAKTLRGSSMQDVIFAGTESRRQLSFCEVTLVFDNSQHLFDIDYEEVAMTRRLYRSGESEYLINMQPCRMRDITNLLHGVGIGKEGYSIIGQGKVVQIMTSKPEERRAIFEEATGVIGFKTKKGEIERKLESAKDNLTVFAQRMDETERTLKPLEKQAEVARKCREYDAKLKYEEVNAFLIRSDTFEQDTGVQRAIIASADAELSELEARLSLLDAEETASRQKIAAFDDKIRTLNLNLRTFEVGMAEKTGDSKALGERIQSYRRQLDRAANDIGVAHLRIKEIDNTVAGSAKKAEAWDKRIAEIEKERTRLNEKIREIDARLAVYERLSDEKRASELSSMENLADVRANAGSLSAKRDAAQDRISEVEAAIEKAQARREEFSIQLAAATKEKREHEAFLDGKAKREEEFNSEIADLMRSEQQISEDIVDCNTSINSLTNNLELYRNLKNRFDGYKDSVRRLQTDARHNPELKKRILGSIADIVRTEKKFEVAIETAFGNNMQSLVTDTADDARYLIEYLHRTDGGVVTFLPVETHRPRPDSRELSQALGENGAIGLACNLVTYNSYYDNVIRSLLGNTLICDTISSATAIARRHPRAFRIITLSGDIIATSGSMTGGSRRRESGNLLASERNIKETEDNIARKKSTLERLREALVSCGKELEETRAALEAYRIRVQEETAKFATAAQQEVALSGLVSDAESDVNEYTALLERLKSTVSDLESEASSVAENEELLSKIRAEAASEAEAQNRRSEQLRLDKAEAEEKLHDLQVELATISSSRAADEENLARLRIEKSKLLQEIEETRTKVAAMQTSLEQTEREQEKVALSDEEQRAVDKMRASLEQEEAGKRAENEKQLRFSEERRALITRQSVRSEEKHAAEVEIAKAERDLENLRLQLDEKYNLTYETANELRDPDYNFKDSDANIASLRHKIRALGPVNQTAVEDYEELLARYTDMQTQKQDLEKGIEDLTQVLNELRDTMQKQFDEGFNEINQNFSVVFKELFGGGRAEMQLDPDAPDPLEAGVEIIACPPGKKLSKITLLSGGEQALTSIAILFAILKSRPMPFCILDEIEAALDEANVDRFAKYLKKFSQDTQFIVITHRKPTMTQADVLFGVTMEEKGVSKIVSVKLSEVESKLGGDTVVA